MVMVDNRRKTLTWIGIGLLAVIVIALGVSKARRVALGKEPTIKVYIDDEKRVLELPMEEYIAAVVGGEMKTTGLTKPLLPRQ